MTKTSKVLEYLEDGNRITSYEAFMKYKITRLSSIIFNLKKAGYNILTETKVSKDGTHYAEYYLGDTDD